MKASSLHSGGAFSIYGRTERSPSAKFLTTKGFKNTKSYTKKEALEEPLRALRH